jgi:hypothetical protein
MGLDARVRCRCWEENRVTGPPPFAEHARFDDPVGPRLELPYDRDNYDKHDAFEQWLETCCPHPRMEQAAEYVANWGGLRQFQSQLQEFGIEQFPTLRDVLPRSNDGGATAGQSAAALKELDDFARRDPGSKVVLVDAETGDVLHEYIPIYRGWCVAAPGNWEAGVDPDGFFVRGPSPWRGAVLKLASRHGGVKLRAVRKLADGGAIMRPARDPVSVLRKWLAAVANGGEKREKFRSRRFRQEPLGPTSFRLVDESSRAEFESPIGVLKAVPWPDGRTYNDRGQLRSVYPTRLAVESRRRGVDEFDYILRPLRVVFRASVETGNPVQWR